MPPVLCSPRRCAYTPIRGKEAPATILAWGLSRIKRRLSDEELLGDYGSLIHNELGYRLL